MSPEDVDFCRVCRCEGTPSKPLFYPCVCTGSIKYVHEECLVQWLNYSKRQTCELCIHTFKFKPVYAANTPRVVPPKIFLVGLLTTAQRFFTRCLHLFTVLFSWLVAVPLTVCRVYKCLFSGNLTGLLSLPLDVLSTEHLVQDFVQGFLIMITAFAAFLGYIWMREQLTTGGEPPWLAAVAGGVPRVPPQHPAHPPAPPAQDPPTVLRADENAMDEETIIPPPLLPETLDQALVVRPSDATELQVGGIINREGEEEEEEAEARRPIGGGGDDIDDAPGFDEFDGAGLMNWDRFFGFDGTMSFLEHALWLVALNIFFILVFAFFPFLTGRFILRCVHLQTAFLTPSLEGIAQSFLGYIAVAGVLMFGHKLFKVMKMNRACYFAGLFYIYIKVAIIAFVELGLFTTACGLWIDACSLGMFNATVTQRVRSFNYAPLVFMFIHWTMGLAVVFYISSLFLFARGIVRPGLLWFVPDFNDPDYKAIHEMISLPVSTYVQRLIVNVSLAGLMVILSLWVPSIIVNKVLPGFLPFRLGFAYDSPVDYSIEIVVLQIVVPSCMIDGQVQQFVLTLFRWWCITVSSLLGIRSYLLGDVDFSPGDVVVMANGTHFVTDENTPQPNASTATTSEDEDNDAESYEPDRPAYVVYRQPRFFGVRLLGLVGAQVITIIVISLLVLVCPLGLGRNTLEYFKMPSHHDTLNLFSGGCSICGWIRIGFLLPAAWTTCKNFFGVMQTKLGLVAAWDGWRWMWAQSAALRHWLFRGGSLWLVGGDRIVGQLQQAPVLRQDASATYAETATLRHLTHQLLGTLIASFRALISMIALLSRLACLGILLIGILPAALGLLINLVIFIPYGVAPEKTLVLGFSEHWIFGIMHLKVWLLILLVGPRWHLRDRLNEINEDIALNWPAIQTSRVLRFSAPLMVAVGLSISLPFLLAHYFGPCLGLRSEFSFRYAYPALFTVILFIAFAYFQLQQCRKLYGKIKDEKYLIGRRLVNYGDPGIDKQNAIDFALSG